MQASSARRFPFTKQVYEEFKDYELSRKIDAQKLQAYARKLQADDVDRMDIAIAQQGNLGKKLSIKWDTLLKCAKKFEEQAEEMKLADALRRRAIPLNRGLMPWDGVLLHWNGVLVHFNGRLMHWDRGLMHWDRGLMHWDCGLMHWDHGLMHWDNELMHLIGQGCRI
nr:zinc finger, RING/FYVE/PHD-type [Tanacetum cinerariifolium]